MEKISALANALYYANPDFIYREIADENQQYVEDVKDFFEMLYHVISYFVFPEHKSGIFNITTIKLYEGGIDVKDVKKDADEVKKMGGLKPLDFWIDIGFFRNCP